MPEKTSPVWFVTGCSSGFGHELAKLIIARGWCAVVTARDKTSLSSLVEGRDATTLALDLDVTIPRQITAAVAAAEQKFGRIDVLVNNAGYGYQSSVEEADDAEIRAQFDVNVFGLFAMTRAVLPLMRRQRSGHVINITSLAGFIGYPGSGHYAASKHAVEGWSDSLAAEGKPIGIKVTCVEPGAFRTDWAGRSLIQTPNLIADYTDTVGVRLKNVSNNSGKQPGDPARAGEAIIRITEVDNPPRHLPLGPDAIAEATKKTQATLAEIEQWHQLGADTNFPS